MIEPENLLDLIRQSSSGHPYIYHGNKDFNYVTIDGTFNINDLCRLIATHLQKQNN